MKKILGVLFLAVLFAGAVSAQQRPQYTQYMINPYVLNPAVGGAENYIDLRAGYRTQWVNMEASPKTFYLSGHGPIAKARCVAKHTKNRTSGFHGVGGYILHDKTGPSSRIGTYASYAYHLMIGKETFASLGVMGGIQQYRLDGNSLHIVNNGGDAAVDGSNQLTVPDFSVGTWIYGRNFYVGASMSQILHPELQFKFSGVNPDSIGKIAHHYFIMGGYKFSIDRQLAFIPSIVFKGVSPAPLSVDLNAKLRYTAPSPRRGPSPYAVWAGLSYRHGDAVAGLVGLVWNEMFDIGYSYDVTMSEIRKYSSNTHEIVIGYRIPLKQNLYCPSHYW